MPMASRSKLPVVVSLRKSARDKVWQHIAECIKRQAHSAGGRDRWNVASSWQFEARRHESLGFVFVRSP
jgi:hypothetical protein